MNRGFERLIAVALLLLAAPAAAQTARPVTIEDAAWIAGRWIGEGLGGEVEEVWSPPAGGQMVGHFSLVRDGAPVFYEIMLIDRQAEGLRLRVKHFSADFTGWEARDGWHSFPPRAAAPDHLSFDGLTMRREGDALLISVTIEQGGAVREELFRMHRAAQDAAPAWLVGSWTGSGTMFGNPSEARLDIRSTAEGFDLHYRAGAFEGRAAYRPLGADRWQADWSDNRGVAFPIAATAAGQMLTSNWGSAETERGRTTYRLREDGRLEVVDFVLPREGSPREFARHVLTRAE